MRKLSLLSIVMLVALLVVAYRDGGQTAASASYPAPYPVATATVVSTPTTTPTSTPPPTPSPVPVATPSEPSAVSLAAAGARTQTPTARKVFTIFLLMVACVMFLRVVRE